MQFDYLVIFAFAVFGACTAWRLGSKPAPSPAPASPARSPDLTAVLAYVAGAGALGLLFPAASALRDCLHDAGPAQSRGIGASGSLAVLLVAAILLAAFAHLARRRRCAERETEPGE